MQPDVSVIIPTYNRRGFLEEAVESCFAGNDAINVEVVVVDDGSTDGTRDYLRSLNDGRVRTFFQEHQGAQVARNTGQQAARGKTIKHLDDDDYLQPDGLERQFIHLQETDIDASYGDVYVIDERNSGGRSETRRWGRAETLFEGLTSLAVDRLQWAYLFRQDVIEGVKWDESLDSLQDVAFMYDVASRNVTIDKVPGEPVVVHRAHDGWRVTDVRNQIAIAEQLDFKCQCVYQACGALLEQAAVPEQEAVYRAQGARGIWNEAHKAAPFDFGMFQKWFERIQEIDPSFRPGRPHRLLAWSDKILSPSATERLLNPIRKMRLSR